MANSQPFQVVEFDLDYCNLTYGNAPCTAALGTTGQYKCFNTFATCQSSLNFDRGVKTVKYCYNRGNVPLGFDAYPVLKGVSLFTSTVNIAGANDSQGAFGRRGTVSVTLQDFPDGDRLLDKYVLERVTGAAQQDSIGYNPVDFGTHFTKLKARFPYYANRPLRVLDGELVDGVFVVSKTRHFIITNFSGPDDSGKFTIEGKDVLSLADDKKALAPKPSRGKLKTNIEVGLVSFKLTPAGIGAEYDTSGWATIGGEIVTFTRVSDTITLTGRGLEGKKESAKNINDTFQQAIRLKNVKLDKFLETLLLDYANIPAPFLPRLTKWKPLVDRWISNTRLNTLITKPTGVAQLVGEMASLGVSIWWDDVLQEVLLLPNTPVSESSIYDVTDDFNIKSIKQEDKDEDRITQIHFYSVQIDPTKDYKDKSNYLRVDVLVDTKAEGLNAFNDTRIKEIFCRFFNAGAESAVRVLSLRLLRRLNTSPVTYTIKLDNKDEALSLTDVLRVTTRVISSPTGREDQKLLQVFRKSENNDRGEFEVSAQDFTFQGRFGYCMPNGSPTYALATPEQKVSGNFAIGPTLLFPDNEGPYEAI